MDFDLNQKVKLYSSERKGYKVARIVAIKNFKNMASRYDLIVLKNNVLVTGILGKFLEAIYA